MNVNVYFSHFSIATYVPCNPHDSHDDFTWSTSSNTIVILIINWKACLFAVSLDVHIYVNYVITNILYIALYDHEQDLKFNNVLFFLEINKHCNSIGQLLWSPSIQPPIGLLLLGGFFCQWYVQMVLDRQTITSHVN